MISGSRRFFCSLREGAFGDIMKRIGGDNGELNFGGIFLATNRTVNVLHKITDKDPQNGLIYYPQTLPFFGKVLEYHSVGHCLHITTKNQPLIGRQLTMRDHHVDLSR